MCGVTPMDKNVGGFDRNARLVVGAILLIVALAWLLGAFALNPWLGAVAIVVGAILLATGATRKCPANSLLGLNTYRRGRTEGEESTSERTTR